MTAPTSVDRREHTDIVADGWIDRFAPAAAEPYLKLMRLDRPIGTWLLLLPCWWGQAMAGRAAGTTIQAELGTAFLFAAGAIVMRGRSEEHTSELQSLMPISYAVFC